MFLRKNRSSKTGRTYLSIVQGYRDSEGKNRHKTVKKVGYLDILEKEYEDPIAHFEKLAKKMTDEIREKNKPIQLSISTEQTLLPGSNNRKNFGHVAFSHLYHELELNYFINNRRRYTDARYNHNAIFKMLVYSRLLDPGSKKKAFENRNILFDKMEFSLDDVYRSLSFFAQFKDSMLLAMHKQIRKLYGRDTSLVYYDVTNYYFEIDKQDELRCKGYSKERRSNPIVQMGLFMDTQGIPLTYGLYPGNMLDKQTLIPMMHKIRKEYDLGRYLVVGDRGMITGDNIRQILLDRCGYVLGYSIRSSDATFKDYVLDSRGYRDIGQDGFRIKSRIYPRKISVSTLEGKKQKISIDEKHIVFYSPKYAQKAKSDRQSVLNKAQKFISSPAAYTKAASQGTAKYIKDLTYSPSSGEVIEDAKHLLLADEQALAEEEKYDGYYAIVTSELDKSDEEIVRIYRGLWKIEDSFRITKSDLETPPVYVSRQDHIEAHFLTCFVALVLLRLLEKRGKGKYPAPRILESLRRSSCSLLEQNIYMFDYYDEILADLGEDLGIDFSRKYRTSGDIKKIIGRTKKTEK